MKLVHVRLRNEKVFSTHIRSGVYANKIDLVNLSTLNANRIGVTLEKKKHFKSFTLFPASSNLSHLANFKPQTKYPI